ncbi:unnamed protein product [Closterium sp. Naga37s-1]|nr:unnamed protein product [Closterium sp. Naga37s-1]
MENVMVAGSRMRKELSVAASIVIDDVRSPCRSCLHLLFLTDAISTSIVARAMPSQHPLQLPCAICQQAIGDVSGPSESHGQLPCAICQQAIGVDAEGREFVPCECAYRICRPCYEYIRAHEGNRCPQCLSKYHRLAVKHVTRASPPCSFPSPPLLLASLLALLNPDLSATNVPSLFLAPMPSHRMSCPRAAVCRVMHLVRAGSPPVDDDPPEEVIRHLEESIPDAPAPAPPAIAAPAPPLPSPSALPAPHTLTSSPLPPSSVPLASPLSSSAPHLALEASSSSPSSASHASASPAAGLVGGGAGGGGVTGGGVGVGVAGASAGIGGGAACPGGGGDESPSSGSAGSPSSYGYGSIVWFTPRRQWSALAPSGEAASAAGVSAASVAGAAVGAAAAGAGGVAESGPSTAIIPVHDADASAGGVGGGGGGMGVIPNDGASADGSPFMCGRHFYLLCATPPSASAANLLTHTLLPLRRRRRVDDTRRPLSRKVPVPSSMLNPYRFAVVVRFVVMILFFKFRVTNPNNSAFLLWLASVVCEIWFGISWIFDQLPKWSPITRETFLNRLSLRYEQEGRPCELPQVDVFVYEQEGRPCELPQVDVFVSTADPFKEPPLVTANVILSVLAADYPVDKVACYLSDDGASMLTFEALMETANFSRLWVPFCRKHAIEPRAPEMYFAGGVDYLLGKVNADFVKERRRMKREYDEFKVRVDALGFQMHLKAPFSYPHPPAHTPSPPLSPQREYDELKREYDEFKVRMNALVVKAQDSPRDGWTMPDGTAWPGNDRSDHVGMIQVFLQPNGETKDVNGDPLPYLVYVSREKRPNYDHNKKAGAMNAMMRASALLTNAPFILNLDCDHYVNNSAAIREAICFLADPLKGGRVCFVQFPQRFDGVDKSDRYANHNTVFYDVNMKGLDGQQGPMYVGTGCVFRRQALYGFDPPPKTPTKRRTCCSLCPSWLSGRPSPVRLPSHLAAGRAAVGGTQQVGLGEDGAGAFTYGGRVKRRWEEGEEAALLPTRWHVKRFGLCHNFIMTVFDGVGGGMATEDPHEVLSDVILVISCGYEDNTEWGTSCGWVYGSVTEDIVTGYKMHTRGWRSVYCMPPRPAFKGSAPINMTDRLAQVLRWATGSVEIFFSQHNPVWADCCSHLKPIQRIAYMNTALYPFTSIALTVYCFLPAISLFSGQFIVPNIDNWAVLYFLALFLSIFATALLEIRWSGVSLEEWWRNEQFWVIGGTSAHFAAVMQGLLKVVAGVEVHFTLTSKASQDMEDELAELYTVRWTWLFLIPLTIIIVNAFAILAGVAHAINNWQSTDSTISGYGHPIKAPTSNADQIGQLVGQVFFSVWVLLHLYPFTKPAMDARRVCTNVAALALVLLVATPEIISDSGFQTTSAVPYRRELRKPQGPLQYNVQETMQLLQESASLVNRAAHLLHADASPLASSFWLRPAAVAAGSPAGGDARAGEAGGRKYYVNLVQTARALQNAVVLLRQKQRLLVMGQINNAMAAIDGVKVVLVPREDRQVLEHLNVARRFAEHAKLSFMGQEQRD